MPSCWHEFLRRTTSPNVVQDSFLPSSSAHITMCIYISFSLSLSRILFVISGIGDRSISFLESQSGPWKPYIRGTIESGVAALKSQWKMLHVDGST